MNVRLLFRAYSLEGNLFVKGHLMRCSTLGEKLKKKGFNVSYGFPIRRTILDEVLIIDGLSPEWISSLFDVRSKRVIYIDSGFSSYWKSSDLDIDCYVNPDFSSSPPRDIPMGTSFYVGLDYSIIDSEAIIKAKDKSEGIEFDILVCPGGNRDSFFNQVDISNLGTPHEVVVAENRSQEELFELMAMSRVIVTTPSVTMVEAIAMGKPVFMVTTSSDQRANFLGATGLGIATHFSLLKIMDGRTRYLLEKEAKRYSQRILNGTDKLIEEIFNDKIYC
jgi:spore coat polysaccharide biosynthesis predicted glycosyltransferase SpsG